jgi:hypothetical protein
MRFASALRAASPSRRMRARLAASAASAALSLAPFLSSPACMNRFAAMTVRMPSFQRWRLCAVLASAPLAALRDRRPSEEDDPSALVPAREEREEEAEAAAAAAASTPAAAEAASATVGVRLRVPRGVARGVKEEPAPPPRALARRGGAAAAAAAAAGDEDAEDEEEEE